MEPLKLNDTTQFGKDLKKGLKSGRSLDRLKEVLYRLQRRQRLPLRFKDHALKGEWSHCRECHVYPDWLLIYRVDGEYLILERIGSHSELFG